MAGNIELVQFASNFDDHRPGRITAVVYLYDDTAVRVLEGHRVIAPAGLNKHRSRDYVLGIMPEGR